jgi:Calcineurin-like phosphoesterase
MYHRPSLSSQFLFGAFAGLALLAGCSAEHTTTGGADLSAHLLLSSADVTNVTATIAGPALASPKTVSLSARDSETWGALIGSLPVGSNYVFTVSAKDATQAQLYAGSASGIAIIKNQVTAVIITAQQVNAPTPFKNAVPVVDSLLVSSTNVTPGATVTATATAHDPDAADSISFAWSTNPSVDGFSAPTAATTNWIAPATEGDVTLSIAVKDNHGATTSASVVVHVSNGNGKGKAAVTVSLNTWPVVTNMVVAPGFIALGQPVSLTVVASDADNDPLTYAWTSTCASGVFSAATAAATTFTLPAGATDTQCEFDVAVKDNRSGSTSGQTTLPVGAPAALGSPSITDSVQSAAVVDANATATFTVSATDPNNSALTFTWLSSAGALSGQTNTAGSSTVTWTAPATGSTSFTVSAVVTDALGMSAQLDFAIKTAAVTTACTPPSSTAWSFGVMSDTQWIGTDDGKNPNSVAVDLINQINTQLIAKDVKLVIQVGDLTDNGSNTALQTTALFRQSLYNAGIGFFPLRGNHESSLTGATEFKRVFPQTQTGSMNATPADVFSTLIGKVDDSYTYPVTPTSSTTFSMGSNFSSPSTGTTGLSYAFDYNNVRFVLLDQFVSFDGTASSSGGNYLDPQLPWIGSTLAGKPGAHAFVFGHKGIITENHVDTLFGSDPSKDPAGQDTFINALANNGVHIYMGGHDHVHNRSLITTTDGVSNKIMDIIGASDSSKFYIPAIPANDVKYDVPAFGHTRQTQITQERNTVGYYIFTVDGSKVTVDFYSAVVNPTLSGSEYLISTSIPMNFSKRETFGYAVGGQEYQVPEGASYTSVTGSFAGTTAQVLSGINPSSSLDGSNRALTHLVDLGWDAATCATSSAILTLWGTADLGTTTGDTLALAMTFDPSAISDATLVSGSFGLASQNAAGNWVSAVSQNIGGTAGFVLGAWNSSYPLGTYGVDLTTNTAWAVVNHAGRFAVASF